MCKKTILGLVFLVSGFIQAQTATLTVNLAGFRSNDGKVKVGLYNEEGKFLKETFLSVTTEIKDLKTSVQFKNLPLGEYAVSVYHDEDNDGKLKTGMFGIPKEDMACSNNAKGKMGPPQYTNAKFTVIKNSTIAVTLNN